MKAQKFTLLIVDDDQNDRFLIERAFKSLGPYYRIHALENGNEAIRYIKGEDEYSDRSKYQFPSYIITDLKMTQGDGFDLLNYIKTHPALSIIPVVMLSGSEDLDDIRQAYLLGVSSYFTKPSPTEDLAMLIRNIHNYWSQCQVPAVDGDGYALMTDSTGKAGERFSKPERFME
ncbi:MAG TPA: response regulator [Candidatus Saccharimonadales bacterium]|nr:response regulator [Candidatus Saccharimonadales bacterium]